MNVGSAGCGFGRMVLCLGLAAFLSDCPASAAEYRLFWGDVHTHTNLSDGKGTPDQLLTYARDVAHLDFVILTDHDFGNGPPWRMSPEAWNQIQDKVDQYTSYYYLRVLQSDADEHGNPSRAWSSPIWVTHKSAFSG